MRRTVNQDFFKKWTPEMAYVLGLWFADGCIPSGPDRTYRGEWCGMSDWLGTNLRVTPRRQQTEA
jgi:hypothetical protein